MSGEILERRTSAPWHFPPARPINTALARLLRCTTVKQIPGKYELVSTCARQKLIQGPPRPRPRPGFGSINMSGEHVTLLSGKNHLWAGMHGTVVWWSRHWVCTNPCFRDIRARSGITKNIYMYTYLHNCWNSQTLIQTLAWKGFFQGSLWSCYETGCVNVHLIVKLLMQNGSRLNEQK